MAHFSCLSLSLSLGSPLGILKLFPPRKEIVLTESIRFHVPLEAEEVENRGMCVCLSVSLFVCVCVC